MFIFNLIHVQTDTESHQPPRHSLGSKHWTSFGNKLRALHLCLLHRWGAPHFSCEPCMCADCVISPARLNLKPSFWREHGKESYNRQWKTPSSWMFVCLPPSTDPRLLASLLEKVIFNLKTGDISSSKVQMSPCGVLFCTVPAHTRTHLQTHTVWPHHTVAAVSPLGGYDGVDFQPHWPTNSCNCAFYADAMTDQTCCAELYGCFVFKSLCSAVN